jgi:hypothetical protein
LVLRLRPAYHLHVAGPDGRETETIAGVLAACRRSDLRVAVGPARLQSNTTETTVVEKPVEEKSTPGIITATLIRITLHGAPLAYRPGVFFCRSSPATGIRWATKACRCYRG